MHWSRVFVLVGLLLLSSRESGWSQTDLRPRVFAITNAKVFSEPGQTIPNGTVVIRDGVIEAVGDTKLEVPPEAIRIDGSDLVVYPGFIDACSHQGYDIKLQTSAMGAPADTDFDSSPSIATRTDNRKGMTPEFEVRVALQSNASTNDNWRKLGFTARLIAPEGKIFSGQSTLVSLSDAPVRQAVLRSPVAMHAGFQRNAASGGDYPRALMGVIAHARQTMFDAGYLQRLVQAYEQRGRTGKRPPVDPSLTALGGTLDRRQTVIFDADSLDEIHQALAFAEEFQLKAMIYGGREAWKVVDRLKATATPVILRLNLTQEPKRVKEFPKRVQEDLARQRLNEARCASVLHENGITFALCTAGLGDDQPWETFKKNLRKIIDAGLPKQVALRALTIEPARLLGVLPQVGTITPGKAAHLVLMRGEFAAKDTKVHTVFSDGIRFPYADEAEDSKTDKQPSKPKEKDGAISEEESEKPTEKVATTEIATELKSDRKPELQTGGDVLIRRAIVLTGVDAQARLMTDILVRGGRIAAIGKDLEPDAGMTVLEAEGMHVMPGIIDTHSHFSIRGGVNEFSLSVVPEVRVRDVVASDDVQIYRALAGGVTTARLLHGSANVIGGQDAVIKLKYGQSAGKLILHDAPRGVKFALGENVKRTNGRFPNTRLGVEAVLIRAFSEAQAYQHRWEEYLQNKTSSNSVPEPRRDLRLEALVDILNGDLRVHCHCYRADEILMLLRVADRFGFKIQSLQHVLEGYKIAPEIAAHGASCSLFSDWWAYKIEAFDAIPYAAALLDEGGAEVCLKSDSNELVRHMTQEAAKCVKYGGMSELKALQAITLMGAKQLGLADRIGSIEVGKDADLAIFNGHPLNSFARCEMTLIEGEVFFQRANRLAPSPIAQTGPTLPVNRMLPIPRNPQGRYRITDVSIHPVSGPLIEGGSILVENGKITKVDASNNATELDDPITVVSAKGMHVYPGFIDAGTVLGLTELGSASETQDYSDSGDFQPDLRAAIGINPDSELIPVTRANGITTVVTRPTGAIIAGQAVLLNLDGWVPSEMTIIDRLALQVELPRVSRLFRNVPGIPRFARGLQRRERDAKVERLKLLFEQAKRYSAARRTKADAPMNPRLEAMIPYAEGTKPVIMQAYRQPDLEAALDLAEKLNLKIILSGATDAWKIANRLKEKDIPVILGPVMSMPGAEHDPYDAPFVCAAKLKQAGVRFCLCSERDASNARNLPYQAAMAVAYGLSPEDGLKAVTLSPAQILGVADQLGSIEVGKRANLVFTNGNLLQATTQVVGLMIDGKPVAPTNKQTRLYERYQQRLKEVRAGQAPLGTN